MPDLIKSLHNCPSCGGILDDVGRCQFCGSKVYDLIDIDLGFSPEKLFKKNKSYIRIKDPNGGIILAPVVVSTATVTVEHHAASRFIDDVGMVHESSYEPDVGIEVRFFVTGDMVRIQEN